MDFFTPIVDESKRNKNFTSVLIKQRQAERDLFGHWADGFVDRDNKIVQEFQTTFNSSFWEIYLFAVFKEYEFEIDWTNSSPDFCLRTNSTDFIVEATTANAAHDKPNEWDKTLSPEELGALRRFKELNTEAIIRLSNSIYSKTRTYSDKYKKLEHVKGKPFVLAVAPFEQPHFNFQYDRPIKALLYDYYVDEDAFLDNPALYPDGPPTVNLEFVEKENGSEIELGLFNDDRMSEISAIIFSTTATWGKLSAIADNKETKTQVHSIWATPPNGAPERRSCDKSEHDENILDGLQIYHNPNAKHPLPTNIFRASRVVQNYVDRATGEWIYESRTNALQFRQVFSGFSSK